MARRRSPLLSPSFLCRFQAGPCGALHLPLPAFFGCCGRDAVPGVGAESLVRGEPLPQFPPPHRHRPVSCPMGAPVCRDLALSLHVWLGPTQSCVGTPGVGAAGWDISPCLFPPPHPKWMDTVAWLEPVQFSSFFFPILQQGMELLGLSFFLAAGSLLPLALTPRTPNPLLSSCLGDTPLPQTPLRPKQKGKKRPKKNLTRLLLSPQTELVGDERGDGRASRGFGAPRGHLWVPAAPLGAGRAPGDGQRGVAGAASSWGHVCHPFRSISSPLAQPPPRLGRVSLVVLASARDVAQGWR